MSAPYCACCDPPPARGGMTPDDCLFFAGACYLMAIGLTGGKVGDGLCLRHATILRGVLSGVTAGHDLKRTRASS